MDIFSNIIIKGPVLVSCPSCSTKQRSGNLTRYKVNRLTTEVFPAESSQVKKMIEIIIILLLISSSLLCIIFRSQLRSAVALGISSVFLAMIFFRLGAPYAGGFELSVGSGLTSILFIMAISLTEERHRS